MSMQTVPIRDYGFLITEELAPYFMLAADRKLGEPPDEITDALRDGTFDEKAAACELGEDYQNPMAAKEGLETAYGDCRLSFVSEFEGSAETMDDADGKPQIPESAKIEYSYDCGEIVYLPLLKEPRMYGRAYADKAEVVEEIKAELAKLGVALPAAFDDAEIAKHVVTVSGTTCV